MFKYELKIPKERIAVLVGKKGEVKRRLERRLGIKIKVDSIEGDVSLSGEEGLNLYLGQNIIKAVGRGFNPETAELLFKEDYAFELIDIGDWAGKKKKKLERLRGRVIGTEGKARRTIEKLSGTDVCVYGKTVGIIGPLENVSIAKRAIESILRGARHGSVFSWLEKQKKEPRT